MVFTAATIAVSAYSAYKTGQNQRKQMKKQMEMQRQANLEAKQRAKEAKERLQNVLPLVSEKLAVQQAEKIRQSEDGGDYGT